MPLPGQSRGRKYSIALYYDGAYMGNIVCQERKAELSETDINYLSSCFAKILNANSNTFDTEELVQWACDLYDSESNFNQQLGPVDFIDSANPNSARADLLIGGQYDWNPATSLIDEEHCLYEVFEGEETNEGLQPRYSYGSIGYIVTGGLDPMDDNTVVFIQNYVYDNCGWDDNFGAYADVAQVLEMTAEAIEQCGYGDVKLFYSADELADAGCDSANAIQLVV